MTTSLQAKLLEDAPIDDLRRQIKTPTQLLLHITAGRSILTVRSHRTQERYTFRFRRPDPEPGKNRPIWVSILGGPHGPFINREMGGLDHDPRHDQSEHRIWAFLGTIWLEEGRPGRFNPGKTSKVPETDKSMYAAAWIARMLTHSPDHLMEEADWWHEGRCGRCGRRLTVPESIESGFGPECAGRVGL